MAHRTLQAGLLLALLCAGCRPPPSQDAVAAGTDAMDPGSDAPVEDVPPATAPDAAGVLAAPLQDFAGALPAPLGADAGTLRRAWDGELSAVPAGVEPDACHFLFAEPRPAHGHGRAFMFEGGRLVRMDVDDPAIPAPGGAHAGMQAAAAAALYPGRVEQYPHKYVEGARVLRVSGRGDAVLVLATDARDVVRSWRIGRPPQVDYVEGCG